MNPSEIKILLIDDNPKNLQVAMNILSKEKYTLIYAQNGSKGLELAIKDDFDLILLDVVMPKMDGYEVCEKLKSCEKTKNIPIIFLTVKDEEKDILKGFECGGVDYVTKPFYATVLLQRVKTHLSLSCVTKELKSINENLTKKVEEQIQSLRLNDQILFQQSKMASMGEMIANIAHQWRQPLEAISLTSLLIKASLDSEKFDFSTKQGVESCKDFLDTKLNDITNYTTEFSNVIVGFRDFFSPKKKQEQLELKSMMENSIKLLETGFIGTKIEILNHSENINLLTYKNELSQVFINILNNAKDALMEKKSDSKKVIFISTKKKDNFIEVSIKDNAGGIKEDIIDRVFEPYFTTKDEKNSTGIGLYMTKEIMQKHINGSIDVYNTSYKHNDIDYKGANFIVKIPII